MKKWILFLSVLLWSITVHAEEEPDNLHAQSAVLMDAESGRVLFEKNGYDIKAMASTTKIMTCIVALENGEESSIVTFSKNADAQPKVHLAALSGEQFYLKDLLYSLMLESHNDTAVAIAEAVAGSEENFAVLMNHKAQELGCKDTYFITPNGLDACDEEGKHSTTAIDLARIMSYCILKSPKKERFLEITTTSSYSFSNLQGNRTYSCVNHNLFLNMMSEAISGKTGFTSEAGYCYVGAVESEGRTFVISLLACGWPNNKNYKWQDMQKIATYALENYAYEEIKPQVNLEPISVENGIPNANKLYEEAEVQVEIGNVESMKILKKDNEIIEMRVKKEDMLVAPVEKGRKVGEIGYYLNNKEIGNFDIVTKEDVAKKEMRWYWVKLLEEFYNL